MKNIVVVALLVTGLPFVAAAQHSGPPATVELDNPSVRVLRIHIEAHARIPAHDVTPRVIVWMTDAHLRMTFSSGESRTEDHKAGDVTWQPAQRHSGENLGDTPIEFVAIVPKS